MNSYLKTGLGGRKERITTIHEETLGSDGYVHYLNCGHGFMVVYTHQSSNCTT